jgi:hypothetical protein
MILHRKRSLSSNKSLVDLQKNYTNNLLSVIIRAKRGKYRSWDGIILDVDPIWQGGILQNGMQNLCFVMCIREVEKRQYNKKVIHLLPLQKSTVFRLLLSYLIGLTGPNTVQAGL